MHIYTAMGLGAAIGVGYFIFQEKSIPKDTVCQFHASPLTDVMTWLVGGMFAYKGYKYNDPLLAIFGTAAAFVHVSQTVHFRLYGFKGKQNKTLEGWFGKSPRQKMKEVGARWVESPCGTPHLFMEAEKQCLAYKAEMLRACKGKSWEKNNQDPGLRETTLKKCWSR